MKDLRGETLIYQIYPLEMKIGGDLELPKLCWLSYLVSPYLQWIACLSLPVVFPTRDSQANPCIYRWFGIPLTIWVDWFWSCFIPVSFVEDWINLLMVAGILLCWHTMHMWSLTADDRWWESKNWLTSRWEYLVYKSHAKIQFKRSRNNFGSMIFVFVVYDNGPVWYSSSGKRFPDKLHKYSKNDGQNKLIRSSFCFLV